jgi:hypothetical protein
MKKAAVLFSFACLILSCKKKDEPAPVAEAQMIFSFRFDSSQVRLDNFGKESAITAGHAAQSPVFQVISAHYIELAPTEYTQLGKGAVLYNGPSTEKGGSKAIDYDREKKVKEGELFLSLPLKNIPPGTYKWIRVSLAYQSYDVRLRASGYNITGRVASFIGYNSYVSSYRIKDSTVTENRNCAQGYWGFETSYSVSKGQAPGTTVPNPIAGTSPIPAGSCVVTGKFSEPLTISGTEAKNISITLSLSTNKSFEWKDSIPDNIWEPLKGENVVDMGIRGLIPVVRK